MGRVRNGAINGNDLHCLGTSICYRRSLKRRKDARKAAKSVGRDLRRIERSARMFASRLLLYAITAIKMDCRSPLFRNYINYKQL